MTAAIAFIMQNWKLLLGGLAVLAFAFLIMSKNAEIRAGEHRIEALTKANSDLTRDLTQCRANKVTLEAGIASQNAALEALRREGAATEARLAQAAATARAAAQTANSRAAAILARRPGPNDCADALALIRETQP